VNAGGHEGAPRRPGYRTPEAATLSEERLSVALEAYLAALEEGRAPDVDEFVAVYPDVAERLREVLQGLRFVAGATGALREARPAEPQATPGQALGDFRLLREIGRGGMGIVYEAEQLSLGRRVALKVLPFAAVLDDKQVTRFRNEARAAGQLDHPHIVSVYAVGCERGVHYYAMRLVEGHTVAELIAELHAGEGKAPQELSLHVARLGAQAADALHHAHERGIVHRDIKPSNLLLDAAGNLLVADFGLARAPGAATLTMSGDILGTLRYMSPEQAEGCATLVDERSDVYSLGATLYELLTGKPAACGESREAILRSIAMDPPVAPGRLKRGVPRDLETIVLKCLEKSPADRYPTAAALTVDLRSFLEDRPIAARRPGLAKRALRWAQRRRALSSALGLLVVTGAVLAFTLGRAHVRERWSRYVQLVEEAIVDLELSVGDRVFFAEDEARVIAGHVYPGELGTTTRGKEPARVVEAALFKLEAAAGAWPWRAEAHYHRARALRLLGRTEESKDELLVAIQRDGRHLPSLTFLQWIRRDEDHPDQAEAIVRGAQALATGPIEQRWLALTVPEAAAWVAPDNRNAATLLDDTLRLLDGESAPWVGLEVELRLRRGRLAVAAGDLARAVSEYTLARRAHPRSATAAALLAGAYYRAGSRESARRLVEESLAAAESPDIAALILFNVQRAHNDLEGMRLTAARIASPGLRAAQLAIVASSSSDPKRALEEAEKALALQGDDWGYFDVSWAARAAGQVERGREVVAEGVRRFPGNVIILEALAWQHFQDCRFGDAIKVCRDALEHHSANARLLNALGYASYRHRQYAAAVAAFDQAMRALPRYGFVIHGRAKAHWLAGNLESAVRDFVDCELVDPGHYGGINHTQLTHLLGQHGDGLLAPHWSRLRPGLADALRRGIETPHILGTLALAILEAGEPDLAMAREHAERAVKLTLGRAPWPLHALARVERASGDAAAAIRCLEQAADLGGTCPLVQERLAAWRREVEPELVTCGSLDAYFGQSTGPPFAAASVSGALLRRYRESWDQELSREVTAARDALEEAALLPGADDEAFLLRLAELRARSGDVDAALGLLETRLLPRTASTRAWGAWLRIAGPVALERAHQILSDPTFETGASAAFVAALRPVLESLRSEGVVRIRCGRLEDHEEPDGVRWLSDRLFIGGRTDAGQRHYPATDGPVLRVDQDRRWFHGRFEYHLPLPLGRYELTIRILDAWGGPGGNEFDVLAGERRLFRVHTDTSLPTRAVVVETAEVTIDDGALPLAFVPVADFAGVSALVLRRLE
jgi:tetratricopeptide (TPR) repeat protein